MKFNRSALVYTALVLGAIAVLIFMMSSRNGTVAVSDAPAGASVLSSDLIAELESLREGQLRKLNFHAEPKPGSEIGFTDPDGNNHSLAEYRGKVVVLNFWATWCAPCRKEMPSLDRLEARLGGDRFAVVPIATSRNPQPAIDRFFAEEQLSHLPVLLDPDSTLASDFGVLSLPVTVILNPEGQEIARLIGDAEWDSDSAIAILGRVLDQH